MASHVSLSFPIWPEHFSHHLLAPGLLPLHTYRVCVDVGPLSQSRAGQLTHSFTEHWRWLSSYERCSFICCSLIHRSLSSAREPGEDQTKEHT